MNITTLKQRLQKAPHVTRVLQSKNYPSLSFTYRNIGRFQIRYFHPEHDWPNGAFEVWHNQGIVQYKTSLNNLTVASILHTCDVFIDNTEDLYNMATNID